MYAAGGNNLSNDVNAMVMELLINDSRTIAEIQKEFSGRFPYLKLEFFDKPYTKNAGSPKTSMYNRDRKIGTCRKVHTDAVITVEENSTVNDLEHDFWNKCGLSVQVFRKSGKLWIETSRTDSWTLKYQNEEGKELSKTSDLPKEDIDPLDRDTWQ